LKKVLIISGNDPHGLAGSTLDVKTVTALGCHPMPVITALTTQDINGKGTSQPVDADVLKNQLQAFQNTPLDAIKIGLVPNRELMEVIFAFLETKKDTFSVLDPVGFSSGGSQLSNWRHEDLQSSALPTSLITPNIPEAECLSGISIKTTDDLKKAGEALQKTWKSVLIKGGHGHNATDYLFLEDQTIEFTGTMLNQECRGTGCALSSGIAALTALGLSLEASIRSAKAFVQSGIENAIEVEADIYSLGTNQTDITATGISVKRIPATLDENILRVQKLVNELKELPIAGLLPEIQANIAYAEGNPTGLHEIVGIPGRLVRFGKSCDTVALPAYGATRHIAKVLLTCKRKDPLVTTVIDICYTPELVEKLKKSGYSAGSFSRADEPKNIREIEGSTLEWGTRKAIEELNFVPDFIYDEGGMGKEPVIRLITHKPEEITKMLQRLL